MEKAVVTAKILENKVIAKGIFRLKLQSEKASAHVKPGQFLNLYLKNKSMLLPRPISICKVEKDCLNLVYKVFGKGTEELSHYAPGHSIQISTSLGNGFKMEHLYGFLHENASSPEKDRVITLAGGGIGVPPLVGLAAAIRSDINNHKVKGGRRYDMSNIKLIAMLGFPEEPYLIEEFKTYCDEVYLATDKGTTGFQGTVLDLMGREKLKPDYCLACGPRPMLKALWSYCEKNEIPLQASMEERMGCGYGACVGCTCKTKKQVEEGIEIVNKKVCQDGPVFMGSEVAWDEL